MAARVPADATAYALRSSKIMVNLFSIYGQPEEAAAHGASIDRFAAIKARYDPTNLFRLNQNIPPSE